MKTYEIRKEFLEESKSVLDLIFKIINNPNEQYTLHQQSTVEMIWPTISKLLITASDIDKIDVEKAGDVIDLLKKGKISVNDAKDLISLFLDQAESDLANELEKQLSKESGQSL